MFQIISLISALFIWILISLGAFVRLHGAGLACPDWPLCYGDLIPPPGFEIALEVGHRFMAAGAGILIIILCILSMSFRKYFFMRSCAFIALIVIILQGILGALTVWMLLNPWIVTFHLIGGNILLAISVYLTGMSFIKSQGPTASSFVPSKLVWTMLFVFFMMLLSGGLNSSTYSGYVCDGFPGCREDSFFPFSIYEWIHMLHRVIAIIGSIILCFLSIKYWFINGNKMWKILCCILISLIFSEIAIGIINAIYFVPRPISGLHTAIAATITVVLTIALLKTRQIKENSDFFLRK